SKCVPNGGAADGAWDREGLVRLADGPARLRDNFFDFPNHIRHRSGLSVQVENVRAAECRYRCRNKSIRRVRNVEKIRLTAKPNMKWPAYYRGLHRFGRVRGQPKITAHPINRQGTQSDAAQSVVQVVNPRCSFVAALECAVERCWTRVVQFSQRAIHTLSAEHCGRARINDSLDASRSLAHGIKHVDRAYDVDHCSGSRVCLA